MDTDIDGVTVPDTEATKERKAKVAKRPKPKAKTKTKKPAKKKAKAKKPVKKSKAKTKRKPAKKPGKSKVRSKRWHKAAKKLKASAAGPERSERIDMRVTKTQKARIIAKAKKLRRTFTSVVLEAIEKIK